MLKLPSSTLFCPIIGAPGPQAASLILLLLFALLTGKMASPYSLRSQDGQQSPPVGPPEIIPCHPGTSWEGTGASNREAQTTFLEMVGLLESAETISIEPTLSHEEAIVFSSALSHDKYDDVQGEDKHFTADEYTRLLSQEAKIARSYVQKTEEAVQQGSFISDADAGMLMEEYKGYSKECCCAAHLSFRSSRNRVRSSSDRFYANSLGRLILLPSVLNDHYGYELAGALLPFLLNKASDEDFMVNPCLPGSLYTVNFVLGMPSGRAYQFTGRPDFTIEAPYCGSIAQFILKGVGEVQSPPARKRESKTAALSQAGIYTIGQFSKQGASLLPAIVLHKDKTVQVAMASLNGDNQTTDNSLGSVSFKLIGQVDPVDLKDPDGLVMFSGLLNGVMNLSRQPPVLAT